jgi:hypothetical protein
MLSKFIYAGTPRGGRPGVGIWLWSKPLCRTAADRLATDDRALSRAGAER